MRYGNYEGKYKGKEQYLVPNPNGIINIKDLYDMFSKMDSILVDLLNMGRMCLEDDDEHTKFASAYFFVKQYGLLGFMVDIPINTDFMLMDEVTLKEDNFISKNCIMKTKDYFELFFPFATNDQISYTVTNKKVDWIVEYYFSGVPYKINMYGKKQMQNIVVLNVEIKLMFIKVERKTNKLKAI